MIFPFNMDFPCHWNPEIKCQKKRDCNGCEHQPADDNKKNGKAPPRHIVWDKSEYGTFPECPACGEMPYSYERCIFCGQKFLPDETAEEMKKPAEEVREDCPLCGGKNTMVGIRAKCNGHFHGECEKTRLPSFSIDKKQKRCYNEYELERTRPPAG